MDLSLKAGKPAFRNAGKSGAVAFLNAGKAESEAFLCARSLLTLRASFKVRSWAPKVLCEQGLNLCFVSLEGARDLERIQPNSREIEAGDVVWFEGDTGIVVNLKDSSISLYSKVTGQGLAKRGTWEGHRMALSNVRSVENIEEIAAQGAGPTGYSPGVLGGMNQVGQGIGTMISNAAARHAARANSGLDFRFRATALPTFFQRVSDETERARLFEALQQALEAGSVDGQIKRISQEMNWATYQPTKEEREAAETQKDGRRKKALSVFIAACILVFAILVGWIAFVATSQNAFRSAVLEGEDLSLVTGVRCLWLDTGHRERPRGTNGIVSAAFTVEADLSPLPADFSRRYDLQSTTAFEIGDFVIGPVDVDGHLLLMKRGEGSPEYHAIPVSGVAFPIARFESPRC